MNFEALRVVRLSECASFQEGYVNPPQTEPSYFGSDVKWLRATDLNNSFVFETGRRLSTKGFKSAGKSATLFEPGTLAISKSGTIGRIGILQDYMCGNRAVINIKPNETCHPRFIFYTLLHRRSEIETLAEGSVQKNLYVSTLGKLEIQLPTLELQKKIASVLGSLDDRIVLLRETNATLEAIAQALFKSWFVDFDPVRAKMDGRIPEGMDEATAALFPDGVEESELGPVPSGWQPKRLGDFIDLAYGKALKANDRVFGSVPVYGSGGITGWHSEALVNVPSVIVGRKGTVGSLYWESRPFFAIDTVFYVKSRYPLTYCYYLLQTLGLQDMNTDAAVPGLNRENVYRLKVPACPQTLLTAFDAVVTPLRKSIDDNLRRVETLTRLRDALIPRLISGQILIPEMEAQVNALAA